jgi:hypothetical protein
MIKVMAIGSKQKKEGCTAAYSQGREMGNWNSCRPVVGDGAACVDAEIRRPSIHNRDGLETAPGSVY